MASNDMSFVPQLPDLGIGHESRSVYAIRGDEKVPDPSEFFKQIRNNGCGAGATIVKRKKIGKLAPILHEVHDTPAVCALNTRYGLEVFLKLFIIEFIAPGSRPRNPARIRADVMQHIMI